MNALRYERTGPTHTSDANAIIGRRTCDSGYQGTVAISVVWIKIKVCKIESWNNLALQVFMVRLHTRIYYPYADAPAGCYVPGSCCRNPSHGPLLAYFRVIRDAQRVNHRDNLNCPNNRFRTQLGHNNF